MEENQQNLDVIEKQTGDITWWTGEPATASGLKQKFFHKLAKTVAFILGKWQIDVAKVPEKCVLIGAPHTSNWDGVFMVLAGWCGGFKMNFLGKDSLFKTPLAPIIMHFGGIPVERDHPHGLVGAMKNQFHNRPVFRLAICPEGTRSWRPYWKSGFYRIAEGAKVPVVIGIIDKKTKTLRVRDWFYLTGDMKKDMEFIRNFYADKSGIRPKLGGPVVLNHELDDQK